MRAEAFGGAALTGQAVAGYFRHSHISLEITSRMPRPRIERPGRRRRSRWALDVVGQAGQGHSDVGLSRAGGIDA